MTLTFNRPEARNALSWEMYERLSQTCEEVDATFVRLLLVAFIFFGGGPVVVVMHEIGSA